MHSFPSCTRHVMFCLIVPPGPAAARSKARVCGRSLSGIAGSN